TFTPGHFHALVDLFSQNVSAKVSFEPNIPGGMKGSAGLCRPRFSFFNIQLSKNRHRRRGVVARTLVARGRSSVAHAALLNFAEGRSRSELLRRQRRAALVGEAYIVGAHPKCQQRFQSFLRRTVTLLASQFRGALHHVLGAICYLCLRAGPGGGTVSRPFTLYGNKTGSFKGHAAHVRSARRYLRQTGPEPDGSGEYLWRRGPTAGTIRPGC
ncbi:hypothetical protein SAMN05428953_1361, partial [Mesorhizobium muleiense]